MSSLTDRTFEDGALYTDKDLAAALGCDARLARQILMRLGIEPVTPRRHMFFGSQLKEAMRRRQEDRLQAMGLGAAGAPGELVALPNPTDRKAQAVRQQQTVRRRRLRE